MTDRDPTHAAERDVAEIVQWPATFVPIQGNPNGVLKMDVAANSRISGDTLTGNGVHGVVLDGGTLRVNAAWNDPNIPYCFTDGITAS